MSRVEGGEFTLGRKAGDRSHSLIQGRSSSDTQMEKATWKPNGPAFPIKIRCRCRGATWFSRNKDFNIRKYRIGWMDKLKILKEESS